MGDPYTDVTVTNYNSNPPSDDGSQVSDNEITWSKHKTKIGDPLKTALESINTNIGTAVDKITGSVVSSALDYTLLASDQGGLVRITGSNKTVTTPAAATVGSPFRCYVLNASSTDLTIDGNASETIDGFTSISLPPGGGVMLDTDGTNWHTGGRNYERTIGQPEGYLTMTSATPVLASDVSAGTAVYYTPDKGALVPISDGSTVTMREFSEMTLTLNSNHVASAIYDVFVFMDGTTMRIGTGPAWNTATAGAGARGTGAGTTQLSRLKGLYVNTVQITARNGATTYTVAANAGIYLGSIYMDGTNGQLTCHRSWGQSRKWGVWNAYNRKMIILKAGDSTASWTYNSATIRQSNGAAGNKLTVFCGLAEELIHARFASNAGTTDNEDEYRCGIGWNSTTAFSGYVGGFDGFADTAGSKRVSVTAQYIAAPSLGINNVNALEQAAGATSIDAIYGGEDDFLLTAHYEG